MSAIECHKCGAVSEFIGGTTKLACWSCYKQAGELATSNNNASAAISALDHLQHTFVEKGACNELLSELVDALGQWARIQRT